MKTPAPSAVSPLAEPVSPPVRGLAVPARTRQLDSQALFAGGKELSIRHHGETYCLRETRQGKLILTK